MVFGATWIVFALIAVLSSSVWSGQTNTVKAVVGIAGAVSLLIYVATARHWILLASIGIGAFLLGIYAVDWVLRVEEYLSVDPALGYLGTIWQLLSTPLHVATKLIERGAIHQALMDVYWTLGMPLLLVVSVALWFARVGVIAKT